MTDLRLDLAHLSDLHDNLIAIATVFENADAAGGTLSAAVDTIGDLQYKVDAFSSNWNDTRGRIATNLRTLATAADSIRESFEDLDALLATEATGLADKYAFEETP